VAAASAVLNHMQIIFTSL